MKYCPYCGADLLDGTVSFCSECGNALPVEKKKDVQQDIKKHKPAKKKSRTKTKDRKVSGSVQRVSVDEAPAADDDYDGYYDDIVPIDAGRPRDGIDKSIVKKIAILIGGLAVIIGICIALMYLL